MKPVRRTKTTRITETVAMPRGNSAVSEGGADRGAPFVMINVRRTVVMSDELHVAVVKEAARPRGGVGLAAA